MFKGLEIVSPHLYSVQFELYTPKGQPVLEDMY